MRDTLTLSPSSLWAYQADIFGGTIIWHVFNILFSRPSTSQPYHVNVEVRFFKVTSISTIYVNSWDQNPQLDQGEVVPLKVPRSSILRTTLVQTQVQTIRQKYRKVRKYIQTITAT